VTLESVIATHNDAALEALASRGLVRRAHRDVAAGRAELGEVGDSTARIIAGGHDVDIDERGPAHARCSCPAEGVCRHILIAVLALREHLDADETPDDVPSAKEELCALSQAALKKFAGADWDKALTIMADGEAVEIGEEGRNLSLHFSELDVSVTFIAGQGVREAVFKGPKTRRRLFTAVAILLVRQGEGLTVSEDLADTPKKVATIPATFIDDAQKTIERAVAATLPGRSAIAQDLFLDLAISTRAEALPRLSAELRGLARQVEQAGERHVGFEADVFLRRAGRAYALLEGLRTHPGDTALTGTSRRDYRARESLDVWVLGSARWRSLAGARGVTTYAFSPADNRWYTVSDGRSAGIDPSFRPSSVYYGSLWGAGMPQELMGKSVRLDSPQVAEDHSVSGKAPKAASPSKSHLPIGMLLDAEVACRDWSQLRTLLAETAGSGLRRRAAPVPALLVPTGFRGFGFNDLEQVYELEVTDELGDVISLSIPGDEHRTAERLRQLGRRIEAILVEVTIGMHRLSYRPVSVVTAFRKTVNVHNVDFDNWPSRWRLGKTLGKLGEVLSLGKHAVATDFDPLRSLLADAVDGLVAHLAQSSTSDLDRLARRCEEGGLLSLANAIRAADNSASAGDALKAAYVAAECNTSLMFLR